MPIEPVELIKLVFGLGIVTVPGYFWSYLFSKNLTRIERFVFGFMAAVGILTLGSFLLNALLNVPLTQLTIICFFIVYATPILLIYVLSLRFFGLPKINLRILKNKKIYLLAGILIFAAFMAFLPHLTNNYYLPFHVDEWEHYTYSQAVIDSGSITFPNPYTGEGTALHPEIGFHVATACISFLSGANLPTIFVFLPAILAVVTSLLAFIIGQRAERKFGFEAAFFVSVIPTTVRFLGPSFYVAVTLGLLFVLFILWLGQQKTIRAAFFITAFILCLFTIHPPTALAAMVIMLVYTVFLAVEKQYKIALTTGLCTILPLLPIYFLMVRWNFTIDQVLGALSGTTFQMDLPKIWVDFEQSGIITWIFFIMGAYFAFSKGKALMRTLCVSALVFLLIIGVYDRFIFGIPIIYERSFLYLFLLMTLIAGVSLNELRKIIVTYSTKYLSAKNKRFSKKIGLFVPLAACVLLLVTVIPAHQEILYYHMIDEGKYTTFTWIHDHIDRYRDDNHSYDRAAVDPFFASPFTAITGVHTISTRMSPLYGYALSDKMIQFLNEKCVDTGFLNEYKLSIVYGACNNSNLTMIYPNVYIYPGLQNK